MKSAPYHDVQSFLIENKEAILSFLHSVEQPRFPPVQMPREHNSMSRSPSPNPRARSASRSRSPTRSPEKRKFSRSRSRSCSPKRSRSRSLSRSPKRYRSSKYSPRRRYRSRSRSPREYRGRGDGYGRHQRKYRDGREKPDPCRCLGIFGMSLDTSERSLQKLFEKYGEIDNIKIIRDHHSGRSRGFGFIYFDDVRDAEDAKRAMTDAVIDGAKVRVDFSVTDGPNRGRKVRSRSPVYRRSRSRS